MLRRIIGLSEIKNIQGNNDIRYVKGELRIPTYKFEMGETLSAKVISEIQFSRKYSNPDALKILANGDNHIYGHLRGIDGPGSSLDLPVFQKLLTTQGGDISDIASTPTIASEFGVKIRFEKADDPEIIEYIAEDYGVSKIVRGKVELNEYGQTDMGNFPAFVFSNIFGLKGVRIICEQISPMAQAGGMESSNVFTTAILVAANMLTGANLTEADIFSLAVKLENDEFDGGTGGQGHLCCLTGGAYQHVWTSGLLNDEGGQEALCEHTLLVQAGKEYKNGNAAVNRTASLTNNIWTLLLEDSDEIGYALHAKKPRLTAEFTKALQDKDFETATAIVKEYVEIRNKLIERWFGLVLAYAALRNGESVDLNDRERELAEKYWKLVFVEEDNKYYKGFALVRELYEKHNKDLVNVKLYALGAEELLEKALEKGIAIMPLGGGGPGANMFALSAHGAEYIKKFFRDNDINEKSDDEVRAIMNGTGELKCFLPFRIGVEPLEVIGFGNRKKPKKGIAMHYDQQTGVFVTLPGNN